MRRTLFEDEHDSFRQSFRAFLEVEACPYVPEWERDGIVSREIYAKAARFGFVAMSVPERYGGAGVEDFRFNALRSGEDYILNGAKTFITNGINADLVIVAAKTDPNERHRGISLLVLERGMDGFERGRNLEKIGQHSQDTAELFFSDVRVPAANLLGEVGEGFRYLV
jgi:alkylation response protein AidB-like acyl-CoA dehydrogenase